LRIVFRAALLDMSHSFSVMNVANPVNHVNRVNHISPLSSTQYAVHPSTRP
jgi:hypothetical protein